MRPGGAALAAAAPAAWTESPTARSCSSAAPPSPPVGLRLRSQSKMASLPNFAAPAGEYADVLPGPPPGLPPDRGGGCASDAARAADAVLAAGRARRVPHARGLPAQLPRAPPRSRSHGSQTVLALLPGLRPRAPSHHPAAGPGWRRSRASTASSLLCKAGPCNGLGAVQDLDAHYKMWFRVSREVAHVRVGAFGLHGISSVPTRFLHSILGHPELPFESNGQAQSVASPPASGAGPRTQRRFVRVHCDNIRALSKTREARLVHVRCATRCSRRCGAARSAPRLLHRLPQ